MSHLGDRAAAFVDGQLTPDSTDRAIAHLASCRPCRDLVELERRTKARLATLVGPAPTADLVGRLLAMGGPAGPLPPRPGYVPGTPRPQPVSLRPPVATAPRAGVQRRQAAPTRPPGRPRMLTPRRTRLAAAVFGALSVVGVGVAGVAVGGATGAVAPRPVAPQVDTLLSPGGGGLVSASTAGSTAPIDWFRPLVTSRVGLRLVARR